MLWKKEGPHEAKGRRLKAKFAILQKSAATDPYSETTLLSKLRLPVAIEGN